MNTAGVAAINRAINAGVRYEAEPDGVDVWQAAPMRGAGDCEDIALAKRAALLAAGVPLPDLRLAICRTELGALHAVLIARTPVGELVLDNRHELPMPRQALGYQWIAIEETGKWFTVED
jgi:predicted transglutaminase-like cysteine proteinase